MMMSARRAAAPALAAVMAVCGVPALAAQSQGAATTRALAGPASPSELMIRLRDDCLRGAAGVRAKLDPRQRFRELDTNGDGRLSREEFRACYLDRKSDAGGFTDEEERILLQHFAGFDRDHDGGVSAEEYAQFIAVWQDSGPDRGGTAGAPLNADPAAVEGRADALIGRQVVTSRGLKAGTVEALAVHPGNGKVHALVPASRFLGIGARTVAIPLDQLLAGPGEALQLSPEAEAGLERLSAPGADWRRIER